MRVIVEVSGGYDSTLAAFIAMGALPTAEFFGLFVDYGQRYYAQERAAVDYTSTLFHDYHDGWYGVRNMTVRGMARAEGEYVPVRNFVIGALAANLADSVGARLVVVGSKTGAYRPDDPYCFRDCTSDFYGRISRAAGEASSNSEARVLRYIQPCLGKKKADVLYALHHDHEVDLTRLWNCYSASTGRPCGQCRNCTEMVRALETIGLRERYAAHWSA